jgi:hypothetical protein
MTDSAAPRARIIDHGTRDAHERLAHLFYELLIRYRVVGGPTTASPFRPASLSVLTPGLPRIIQPDGGIRGWPGEDCPG